MREIFLERNDKNKRGFYMYELEVFDTFDAAHRVVGYPGKCDRLHGHTWKVAVHVAGTELDSIGMLVDFKKLKEILKGITEEFDHTFLNEHEAFNGKNPTAENIARYIYQVYAEKLRAENPSVRLSDVRVWESPGSSVTYRED